MMTPHKGVLCGVLTWNGSLMGNEKILFSFSKNDPLIYISHLDLLRLFGRSARRAGLPVALTEGFSPHLKIKLKNALKLGVASASEEGEIILSKRMSCRDVQKKWQKQLPEGIVLTELRHEA